MRVGLKHEVLLAYQPVLWKLALQLCDSYHDAEDVVQTANERLLAADTPDNVELAPAGWMRLFVKRAWQHQQRNKSGAVKRMGELRNIGKFSEEPDQVEATYFNELMVKLESLPECQRGIFKSMNFDGMNGPEAAEKHGYKDKRSAHYHLDAAMHSLGLADGKMPNMKKAA